MTFFGLNSSYKLIVYSEIHEIVFHGKGGYDWETVYNMPIWLRKFTFNKIKDWYDKEKEAHDKANKQFTNDDIEKLKTSKPNIAKPPQNTYTTKASPKK